MMRPRWMIDLVDQAVIGRPHLADLEIVGGDDVERAVLVIGAGPADSASISKASSGCCRLSLSGVAARAGNATSAGSTTRVVGLRRDQRRMRAEEHEMREPRPLLAHQQPFQELVGEEGRLAVLGRELGRDEAEAAIGGLVETFLRPEHVVAAVGKVVALGDQVGDPGAHVLRQMQRAR